MLNLGFRTHDFGIKFQNADELGKTVMSYRENACIHLAPYKALADAPKPFTNEWAAQTKETLDKYNVKVAILGCYINMVHPDPDALEIELRKFENGLEVAKSLGNPIVATETGSIDPRNVRCEETWTPKNMYRYLKIVERLLTCAEKHGVTMAIEAVADKNTIDTPERMNHIMETFQSPNLCCLFDAVNILPIYGVEDFRTYYDNAVAMLAPYIKAMHLKDFVWASSMPNYPFARGTVKKGNVAIGEGLFPWRTVFQIYRKYGVDKVPMTLENFRPETVADSFKYIESCYNAV